MSDLRSLPPRVIVYDGQCFLCNSWLRFIPPRDPDGRIHFCPMQTATGQALLRKHGIDTTNPESFLFVEDGRAWKGSEAVIRILHTLGGPWRLATLALSIPSDFREATYRLISRNRYRISGRSDMCIVPTPDLRSRFVDWPEATP